MNYQAWIAFVIKSFKWEHPSDNEYVGYTSDPRHIVEITVFEDRIRIYTDYPVKATYAEWCEAWHHHRTSYMEYIWTNPYIFKT